MGGGKITGPDLATPVQLPGSDFRIRADGSAIEPVTGQTHTFGFAFTEAGDRFTVTTTASIFVAPLPWHYLVRNPDAAAASHADGGGGSARLLPFQAASVAAEARRRSRLFLEYYKSRYGAAESEPLLVNIALAFEEKTKALRAPRFLSMVGIPG